MIVRTNIDALEKYKNLCKNSKNAIIDNFLEKFFSFLESATYQLCTSEETSESRWVAKDKVLDMVTAPAIRTRYQAYLDFDGNINYMAYETSPKFELKLKRTV